MEPNDTITASLRALAERWAETDPDPITQAELRALLRAPALAATDLADRFAGPLEFGTAGLRGILGAGPNRMNRAVIRRTTRGLAEHLLAAVPGAAERGVVIGYDGRVLSREFAADAAGVLVAKGIRVHLFETLGPTPLTAFAVGVLGAACGVMVTASHNPPEYNGYKVYWGNGAQIIPPTDAGIARAIEASPAANAIAVMAVDEARRKGLLTLLGAAMERRYLDAIAGLGVRDDGDRSLVIVYTPLHGVGHKLARMALDEAGFRNVHSVAEQAEPDGRFPTVAFPNPEEPGAMHRALLLAREKRAELVIANDPDADRLAVCVPSPTASSGYVQLTGNEVGTLLGHYLLTEASDRGPERLVVTTCVSSPMLGTIARGLGVQYEETLTGFKWISNRGMDVERERGARFVFGYEEALGYTVGAVVRDKDGIGAARVFAELVAVLRARGKTVQDELEAIARRFGLFASAQVNVTRKGVSGAEELRAMMDRLRSAMPRRVGAHEVVAFADYAEQRHVDLVTGIETELTLPQSNVVALHLAGGSRIVARPSGTEPKVKFYFDVREAIGPGELFADARARAEKALDALSAAFVAEFGPAVAR